MDNEQETYVKTRPLSEEEIRKVREAFTDNYGHHVIRDRCLFELGINAGARITELLALDVGQVYNRGRVVDQVELVQRGLSRTIPLNFRAREALSTYIEWKKVRGESLHPDAPLFLSQRGIRMTRKAAHLRLVRLFRRCGLQGEVSTRSLRKTFGTRLMEQGIDLRTIQALLGHKKLSMTERYLGVTEPDLRAAVKKLD